MPDIAAAPEAPPSIDSILDASIAGAPLPSSVTPPDPTPGDMMAAALSKYADESGNNPAAPAAPETPPAAEAPVVATEETPPVEPPAALDTEALPNRFRFNSDEDKAVAMLARTKGISLVEAASLYKGDAAPAVETAPPVPELPEVIQTKEARLAEIRAAIDEQVNASDDIGVTLTKEIRALQKEEADLIRELPKLEMAHQQHLAREAAVERKEYNTVFDQWEAEAVKDFPDAAVPDSALFQAIAAEASRLQAANDPLLKRPDCAYLVAASVAKQTGYRAPVAQPGSPAPAVNPAAAPPAATPQAQPRVVNSVPGNATSDAHRVTVASPTSSPLSTFQQVIQKAGNQGMAAIEDGLEAIINGSRAVPAGPKLW